ncbi:MAG: hypothetical protein QOE28_737 [Solirubrobacteraceae bacterium]|nr:hypothetical protein [Solirubrobacteraceae bacterium]
MSGEAGIGGELEESAEDLYDNAPCGYLSTAAGGMIVRVNATFLRWTGYRREELVGERRFQDLLTAGGRIYHETHYAPLLRMQGSVREIALDIVRADGSRLPALVNSQLRPGAAGVVRTTVFEATDRKRYEQELLAARNRERAARERIERLQEITAKVAAAAGERAIGEAVVAELAAYFGAPRAGIAVTDDAAEDGLRIVARHGAPPAAWPGVEFDESGGTVLLRLTAAAGAYGRLWLGFDEPRAFEADERAFLRVCAEQAALAIERARLYQQQRHASRTLQQSLLSGLLPEDRRYEIATAYLPAVEHLDVGGDWYDAFTLPGGRLAISVGDVVGHGIAAASAMGQLRSAVRALASAGAEPGALLEHLDAFVEQVASGRYATLVYAEVDPDSGRVCCASAGHPPALLLEPGREPRYFMEGRSTPLGVPPAGGKRAQAAFILEPGGGFLFFTDGLVERRTEPIDAGLARLLETVQARRDDAPAQLVAALLDRLLDRNASHDDVCLLSFRRG